jgi:rSAM/selenodomain-associated transferase 2
MISIVCPIYNEEKILSKTAAHLERLSRRAEFIFVDGGSADRSVVVARQHGKVFHSKKGRAAQMNYGAGLAKGEILLFLHADTIVSTDALETIESKINEDGVIGGCFTQRIDNGSPLYRIIESQGNLRARARKVFYGDQGIFVKKDVFLKIGGFPEAPILEDVLFTKKLRKAGKTVVLPDEIIVSARRWEKRGVIRTVFLYHCIIFLFWLKVPLHKIKELYEDLR